MISQVLDKQKIPFSLCFEAWELADQISVRYHVSCCGCFWPLGCKDGEKGQSFSASSLYGPLEW